MSRPTRTPLSLARSLHDLAERDDLPRPEVRAVTLRSGASAVQAAWRKGAWCVVVTVLPRGAFLSCHRGWAALWRQDLEVHGIDTLRRALAWLAGEVKHPEDVR